MKSLFQILIIFLLIPLQLAYSQTASLSPTSLDERNLRDGDGDTLIITLTGATFDADIDGTYRFNLSDDISGMLVRDIVERIDDNNVRLILYLSGNIDSNTSGITVEVEREITSHNADITTSNSFTVNYYDEPTADLSGGGVICGSGTRPLTIDFTGTKPFKYNYRIGAVNQTEVIVDAFTDIINATQDATYTLLYVEDANGIRGELINASETVSIETIPTPSISGPTDICGNTQQTYQTADVSGNTYNWTESGGSFQTSNGNNSREILWGTSASGWVSVTETTPGGCSTATGQYAVTLKPVPTQPIISGDDGFCPGDQANISSSAGLNYLWSPGGATTQSIIVSSENTYSVRVSNADNCWSLPSGNYTVTAFTTPKGWISINKDEICAGESADLKITVNSYNSNWDAVYFDGSSNQFLSNISTPFSKVSVSPPAGNHTYTLISVEDDNCPGEVISFLDEAYITVNPAAEIIYTKSRDQFPTTEDPYTFEATPAGGTFSCSAPGAISSDGIFSPDKADTCACNIITYEFTNANGCTSRSSITVEVYVAKGDFVAPGSYDNGTYKYIYCSDATPDIISIENLFIPLGHAIIGSNWIGPVIPDGSDPLKATFNPVAAGDGFHYLSFVYITQQLTFPFIILFNQLPPELFVVDYVGSQTIDGLLDEYCLNADSVELKVTGFINALNPGGSSGVPLFEGPGVSSPGAGEFWFNPDRAGSGNKTVSYSFTRDFSQCAITDQQVEVIHPLPRLGFDIPDVCIFTDPTIPDSTQFINTSLDFASVVTWSWDFGDPTSGADNISDLANPYHDYNSDGSKTILLSGTDLNNCTDVYTPNPAIELGRRSLAAFTWENECDVDTLNLFAEDDGLVTEFHWNFGDGTTYPDLVTQFPKHHFPGAANYELGLIVRNSFNCFDSIKHVVPIRTTYTIRSDSTPYFEDFDQFLVTSNADWVSGPFGGTSIDNWNRALLEGSVINDQSYDSAWVTNPAGFYSDGEQSYVEGPCFDFTEVKKPMIKFNFWIHAETGKDGVVLQSSVDDGKNWDVVGSNKDGIEWYNSALLFGQPGGQRLGWTGTTQTAWKEARNLLDPIIGNRVRFRFVLGANPDASSYDGFAFDNIWIGERSRIVLLEHFTNENATDSPEADSDVNEITLENNDEVIDIQYHTSFPGQDTRNLYYPAGPSARSLYYGITSVPHSVMDGQNHFFGFDGTNNAYSWEEEDLLRRVLVDPLLEIDLSSSELSNNSLNVISNLHLLDGNLKSENLTLYLAVVENETSIIKKVLKKMIPHSTGTSLFYLWTADDSAMVNYTWDFNPADFVHLDSLILVAFVQDELSKAIYQAAFISFKDILITGIENNLPGETGINFNIYPNPAENIAYIEFSNPLQEDLILEVYNELGSRLEQKILHRGGGRFTIDTYTYSRGIYFLRLRSENSTIGTKRLVIIH